jgi:hypothetical protein
VKLFDLLDQVGDLDGWPPLQMRMRVLALSNCSRSSLKPKLGSVKKIPSSPAPLPCVSHHFM